MKWMTTSKRSGAGAANVLVHIVVFVLGVLAGAVIFKDGESEHTDLSLSSCLEACETRSPPPGESCDVVEGLEARNECLATALASATCEKTCYSSN